MQEKSFNNFYFFFQVVAFATFFNHQSAVAALHALNVRLNLSKRIVFTS